MTALTPNGPPQIRIPVPLDVVPFDVSLALVADFVARYRAVVTETDVVATNRATFTLRFPGEQIAAPTNEE